MLSGSTMVPAPTEPSCRVSSASAFLLGAVKGYVAGLAAAIRTMVNIELEPPAAAAPDDLPLTTSPPASTSKKLEDGLQVLRVRVISAAHGAVHGGDVKQQFAVIDVDASFAIAAHQAQPLDAESSLKRKFNFLTLAAAALLCGLLNLGFQLGVTLKPIPARSPAECASLSLGPFLLLIPRQKPLQAHRAYYIVLTYRMHAYYIGKSA